MNETLLSETNALTLVFKLKFHYIDKLQYLKKTIPLNILTFNDRKNSKTKLKIKKRENNLYIQLTQNYIKTIIKWKAIIPLILNETLYKFTWSILDGLSIYIDNRLTFKNPHPIFQSQNNLISKLQNLNTFKSILKLF